MASTLAILCCGCEENLIMQNSGVSLKQTGVYEGPGTFAEHSNGDDYPYPEIIHQVIIPNSDVFHLKTLAWRITWPTYADDADPEKIPSIWSGDGILHSIDYLNNVAPENTYKSLFSLYFDETIQRTSDMAGELDYVAGAPDGSMETILFNDTWSTAKGLQILTESDAAFHMMWQVPTLVDEFEYEDEDILWYRIGESKYGATNLYGAIRIVSMDPRIIEVFLAVPTNFTLVDDIAN